MTVAGTYIQHCRRTVGMAVSDQTSGNQMDGDA
jgi:hypothetical protein